MSIRWDTRNKRWRFEFDAVIAGRRRRTSRLLPKGWSKAEASAFDQKESGRLFSLVTGTRQRDPLIQEAVSLYLDDKTHLKSYKPAAEHLTSLHWAYVDKNMSDLPAVAALVVKTEASKLAPATIRNRLSLLKAACRHAWKVHGLTEADPTARMKLPQVRNERHVYLSRGEMLGLASLVEGHDVRAMIRTAFYTGMRLGELQRVEVSGDTLLLRDTKNGDVRAIPAHPRIRSCLHYLPLTGKKRYYQHAFKKVRDLVGWTDLHIHDLRHSAASEMVNAEVDLYTIGQVLGHRDPRSTARYAHLDVNKLSAAIGKIGQKSPHNASAAGNKKAA